MQLRCTYCQTMFALSRDETLAALEHMDENHLIYYDAHCPKCRRANRVERFKLESSYPHWREAVQEIRQQAENVHPGGLPQPEAPTAAPTAGSAPAAPRRAKHTSKGAVPVKPVPTAARSLPAAKVAGKPKPALKKAASARKPTASARERKPSTAKKTIRPTRKK